MTNIPFVPFIIGIVAMWICTGGLALIGWRRGEPMVSDNGKWRIFWERAFFRDLIMILRWCAGAVLIAIFLTRLELYQMVSFVTGVLAGIRLRYVGELPVILLVRYGVAPGGTSAGRKSGGGQNAMGDGRDP